MEPNPKLDPITETALRSLHDIAVPPPVSWMPQTWGWAALAAILLVALLAWAFLALRRYRRNAYRREALRLLDAVASDIRSPLTRKRGLQGLAEVLKRTALAVWPRERVASLAGPHWNEFLDGSAEAGEGHALERLFDDFEYRDEGSLAALSPSVGDDLLLGARRWIEKHHVPT